MSSTEQGVKSMVQQTNDQRPHNDSSAADDGYVPSCWICLEEGPDQSGKGLVRDCSCRGNSGFAHLGCLVEYAKRTSIDRTVDQLVIRDGLPSDELRKFIAHWEKCSICHQMYHGELALDLANSFILYINEKKMEKSPMDQYRYMYALIIKINVLHRMLARSNNSDFELEGKQTAYKLLAMAQQMKSQYFEAIAHESLGYFDGLTRKNYKEGIKHDQNAIKIFESMGATQAVRRAENHIALIKARHDYTGPESSGEGVLKNAQEVHEQHVQDKGEHSMDAITSGTSLAVTLGLLGRGIESERLLTKQMRLSIQLHGREHDFTKLVKSLLEVVKERKVTIPSQPGVEFEAVGYEIEGDKYAVRRAWRWVMNKNGCFSPSSTKGEIFYVASKDILWREGIPVAYHGLKKASHLNGKIGDARSFNDNTGIYDVHFEHARKPVALKKENLRIWFDFPY